MNGQMGDLVGGRGCISPCEPHPWSAHGDPHALVGASNTGDHSLVRVDALQAPSNITKPENLSLDPSPTCMGGERRWRHHEHRVSVRVEMESAAHGASTKEDSIATVATMCCETAFERAVDEESPRLVARIDPFHGSCFTCA